MLLIFRELIDPTTVCTGYDIYSKTAVVTGWGRTNASDPSAGATRLQKLSVKILPNSQCRHMVKREYEEVLKKNFTYEEVAKTSKMGISETQICGLSKNSTSVCHVQN